MRLDVLELWVPDLGAVQDVLTTSFGFRPVALRVEGAADRVSAVSCGGATIVLRQARSGEGPVAEHVARHGSTVADVVLVGANALQVADRARAYGLSVAGAPELPRVDMLGDGTLCHSLRSQPLLERGGVRGSSMFRAIDHVAYCLPCGALDHLARTYQDVFNFDRLDVGDAALVGEEATGMRSTALRSRDGFTVVLTEPLTAGGTGQTQRFLDEHAGAGVQHAALACDDVISAVRLLRSRGARFLDVPDGYYDDARRRLQGTPLPWDDLRDLGVLVDMEYGGLLFQLFTRPISTGGPFFELIQRVGATGFGANNVRALFAAVDQAMNASSGDGGKGPP